MIMPPIDASSPVYCVLGDPISHSLSPLMHNRALAECGLSGVYVGFRVVDAAAAMNAIRALGIRGASVTIPHKVAVMAHLDQIDETARVIGAVNTVVHRDGQLIGINTDGAGALKALAAVTDVAGRKVAILGAGGAARAVAWAVGRAGGKVTLYNRTEARAAALARELGMDHRPLGDISTGEFQILINATSVGMAPDTEAMPLDPAILDRSMVVMDIVYNPMETALLAAARRRGCRTVDGVAMFVGQGARQFQLWTGSEAPVAVMHRVVVDALAKRQQP
jgi:shikimate dehydrogenase